MSFTLQSLESSYLMKTFQMIPQSLVYDLFFIQIDSSTLKTAKHPSVYEEKL